MSDPAPEQIRVATEALHAEADRWQQQAGTLAGAAAQARALDMTTLEAGVFGIFASAYQQAHAQVVGRCTEGGEAMTVVASTLRDVAGAYEREEAANEHRFRNLY